MKEDHPAPGIARFGTGRDQLGRLPPRPRPVAIEHIGRAARRVDRRRADQEPITIRREAPPESIGIAPLERLELSPDPPGPIGAPVIHVDKTSCITIERLGNENLSAVRGDRTAKVLSCKGRGHATDQTDCRDELVPGHGAFTDRGKMSGN